MAVKTSQNRIGVKDAVKLAMTAIKDLLPADELDDLRLEEVEQSPGEDYWLITLGFNDRNAMIGSVLGASAKPSRQFKIFKIDAGTGQVKSMKIRVVP